MLTLANRFALFLAIVTFGISIYWTYNFLSKIAETQHEVRVSLQQKLEDDNKVINDKIANVMQEVTNSADDIMNGVETNQLIHVKKLFNEDLIEGVGIATFSHTTDKKEARHFEKSGDQITSRSILSFYDYVYSDWYIAASKTSRGTWLTPYNEPVLGRKVVRFVIPLFLSVHQSGHRHLAGALYVDISHARLSALLNAAALREVNHSYIITASGTVVVSQFDDTMDSFEAIASLPGKEGILELKKEIFTKQRGITTYFDNVRHKKFWLVHQTLNTGWIAISEATYVPLMAERVFRQKLFDILLVTAAFFFTLGWFIVFKPGWKPRKAWIFSSLYAGFVALLSITILVIYSQNENITHVLTSDRRITTISSVAETAHFKQIYSMQSKQLKKGDPAYVPTGLIVDYLTITEDNKLLIEGTLWQRNGDRDSERAVAFANVENQTFTQIHEETINGEVVRVWHFSAAILNYFDFVRYPFDNQLLTVSILNTNLSKNIVFVPDFDSYDTISDLIGLSNEIKLSAWNFTNSFFYFKASNDQANLGLKNNIRKSGFPDLNFAITIERLLLSAIIITTLPILIIAVITFLVLLQTSRVKRDASSLSKIIPQLAAIFFATVLAHQSFKRTFTTTSDILYAEYYYFILYGILMLVAINTVVYLSTLTTRGLIASKGNLDIKMIYWPLITVGILLTTLMFFY